MKKSFLFDLHLDLEVYLDDNLRKFLKDKYFSLNKLFLKRHWDLIQAKKTNLKYFVAQVQSVKIVDNEIKPINSFNEFILKSEFFFKKIKNLKELNFVKNYHDFQNKNKINFILGSEGLYFVKNLKEIEKMWLLGFRVFGLSWNLKNKITGTILNHNLGLTQFGKKIVDFIIKLGGVVDLAHSSNKTRVYILNKYPKNSILSHNNIFEVYAFNQNLDKTVLALVKQKNILVGLTFLPKALEQNNFLSWKKHYDFLFNLNKKSLALGTDFFGFAFRESALDSDNYLSLEKNFKKFKIDKKLLFDNAFNFFYNLSKKWN